MRAAEHRIDQRKLMLALGVGTCALACVLGGGVAVAQKAPASLDTVHQRDQELEAVRVEQKKAIEAEKQLRSEIEAIGEDRRKLNQALIDTAAQIRSVETRIVGTEARLGELQASEDDIRKSLDGRRAMIGEVLAALQRIGRRPPPAVMVRPEDALEAVRTAVLLGAVLPQMRQEADALASDLVEMVRLRAEIAGEREHMAHDLAALSDQKGRMDLLVAERQRRQGEVEKALDGERQRAVQLARQADNLKDLIARLEHGLDSAGRAARKAEQAEGRPETRSDLAVLKDPGRLGPAVAFASAKGMLPMPVNGIRVKDFGAPDGAGGSEKGISVASRAGAQVTAPCDGWVVYAAPYRSYGQLLILNAGGGYHVVLAGMGRISVDLGQFVLTGEPVAVMGNGPQVASAVMTGMPGASQPVLYIEFRKDGSPVDPTPWWATTDSEKVRG
jgi:septal ring factor EnvC (AmiA/AmiB activator)